tara:strand:- start:169497 stop:169658 length:162 start_codon:yes stop_codon:yes gene_type:complete
LSKLNGLLKHDIVSTQGICRLPPGDERCPAVNDDYPDALITLSILLIVKEVYL